MTFLVRLTLLCLAALVIGLLAALLQVVAMLIYFAFVMRPGASILTVAVIYIIYKRARKGHKEHNGRKRILVK